MKNFSVFFVAKLGHFIMYMYQLSNTQTKQQKSEKEEKKSFIG